MKNKKIINFLLIGLISIIVFPLHISAKSINTIEVNSSINKLTVSGTTEDGVLAVAVVVYSNNNLSHMETCATNNNSYSCELNKSFDDGEYVVKVADYDGGEYITKTISLSQESVNNPPTGDQIMKSIILGSISLICLCGVGLYIKKKKNC